jgi:alpha-D-xyloside xylohydrolase
MGPEREYASEKPDAPIELRVYRGADGSFVLYQDQGDSYAYEHGAYATIPIRWEESSGTLTIGARQGSFPGMASQQKFQVIWVDAKHGGGAEVSSSIDK